MSTAELATSYAALILADDVVDITAEKLQSLIKAAKIPDVEPIWSTMFANSLEDKNADDVLLKTGSGSAINFRTRAAPQNKRKHLSAYLLLGLAGNTLPSAEDVKVGAGHLFRPMC
jgi:ribosomal protein L12E/L44/L45/RPP1/RPP2